MVLATHNAGKVVELRQILGASGSEVELLGMDSFPDVADVVETGVTFAENALLKAHAVARATQLPAVADDSGLAVDVLGGSPGVFSARWAGRHGDDRANLDLLLAQVGDVPDEHRQAQFVCAAALALPDGTEKVWYGKMPGTLLREPRGTNGFGYDPILRPEGETRSAAELSAAEKNAISHRGKAFRLLAAELATFFQDRP
nr:RdgB/HAM1 family non-canonical purine NTP pyrophosphatase [Kineosporia babensis]